MDRRISARKPKSGEYPRAEAAYSKNGVLYGT